MVLSAPVAAVEIADVSLEGCLESGTLSKQSLGRRLAGEQIAKQNRYIHDAQHVAEAMASLPDPQDVIMNGKAAGNLIDNIYYANRHLIRL